jgi:sporulation protein YlmC with PRC-barrel domain
VLGTQKMKTILFDTLDEAGARKLAGCQVVDESGKSIGTVDGLWMDSTSRRVEFVGVKSDSLSGKVHLVTAGDAQIIQEGYLIKLRYPSTLIARAPSFLPGAELAQLESEEINRQCGRSMAPQRIYSNNELPPEEANAGSNLGKEAGGHSRSKESTDRQDLAKSDQAFFNQSGFVTDSILRWMLHKSFCGSKMKPKHGIVKTGSRADRSIK